MPSSTTALAAFDLKSTRWTLTALRLQTANASELARALDERFHDSPGLFDGDPVVLDLSALRAADSAVDFKALLPILRRFRMTPIAVQSGSEEQTRAALAAALVDALDAAAIAAPMAAAVPTPVCAGSTPPQRQTPHRSPRHRHPRWYRPW